MAPPTIVLLHGFTQTGRSWDPVVAAMGERYRALAPDLRGHGSAADARPVDFGAIEADVLALAPRRLALAGYSMGGRIALDLALSPEGIGRIDRLTLIGASPGLRTAGERAARRAADEILADRIEAEGVEAFARRWAAQPLFADQPPAVAAAAHAERLRSTPAGLAASLRGVGTGAMEPLWERLGELRVPVTLIAGERDAKFRALAEQMAALIPDATLHVVAGAGHAVQLEQPEAVAALL
ncbi:2-succinyl-6-hydroxy-2,4-cyclohexadiene-1-carboxylate synthase [Conexibacter sp. CPCC 206217]|uniref:2-succinyl-6-hydroxy-2, 4-cyclohexadiene-1-carboxylate synthase n=1 Tax=Conexibacter sp. CPCC 206217 TaxID=3064574 RepID=UPI0027217E7A|nr:2-succinyl-6-hydroxy-2,4-cyclohexadiene-1-carboxylate synthase [Conexibacter sp. CPCC 206217]MDO8212895.1 2-succinyl-6-hydroxy-2,4-cyclohexadiene-1-carboxylate synthase [Conexibacter sp. CPCC 206217]